MGQKAINIMLALNPLPLLYFVVKWRQEEYEYREQRHQEEYDYREEHHQDHHNIYNSIFAALEAQDMKMNGVVKELEKADLHPVPSKDMKK